MINVTEEAKLILRGILDDALRQYADPAEGSPEPGLRLLIDEDGASFALDYPQAGDQVVVDGGKTILIVASDIAELLGDSTVDIIQSPDGDQLSIQRNVPSNGHGEQAA